MVWGWRHVMQPVHVGICIIWVASTKWEINLWPNTDLWPLTKTKDMETVSIAFRSPAIHNSVRTSPRPIFGSQPTSWKPLVCSPSMSGRDSEGRLSAANLPVRSSFMIGTISPPLIFFLLLILLTRMILPLLFAFTRAYIIPPLLCRISLF